MFTRQEMTDPLLKWFDTYKENLPWRVNPTPYSVWISEVMLQQTLVQTVIPYYKRWMEFFPDIKSITSGTEKGVMLLWEGLGYYTRARNIFRTAHVLMEKHAGRLPDDYDNLFALPGIGVYIASAILSIAFQKMYPVIEANVKRIAQRLHGWHTLNPEKLRQWESNLRRLLPEKRPGDFNQALMEHGQKICVKTNPECLECPLRRLCVSYRNGWQSRIPVKIRRPLTRKRKIIIAFINRDRVLLERILKGLFQGLWIFPAVEINTGQKIPEELIKLEDFSGKNFLSNLPFRTHFYTHYRAVLYPVVLSYNRKLETSFRRQAEWVRIRELGSYPMPSVYRKIVLDLHLFLGLGIDGRQPV